MNRGRLLVIGAGGHALVAGDCAQATGRWSELLFFDDRWPVHRTCGPWHVAGKCADVASVAGAADEVFVAIGNNQVRLDWLSRLADVGLKLATIVHPHAHVSQYAKLGAGSLVVAGAVVNIGSELAIGCIANTGCGIDHDCRIGEAVHICPGAHLAGNVRIGALSWIGLGSAVSHGINIGQRVTVGAGAVVIKDVAGGLTVIGVPARPSGTQRDLK